MKDDKEKIAKEFASGLRRALEISGIQISPKAQGWLTAYYLLVRRWANRVNITANLSVDRFVEENVVDPLVALRRFEREFSAGDIADLGCGGGFVGFIWQAFARAKGRLLLVESNRKRANFCREVRRRLAGSNVSIICGRVEDCRGNLGGYDTVLTRATWPGELGFKKGQPFCRPGGRVVLFWGPRRLPERSRPDVRRLGYSLGGLKKERWLVVKEKLG